jgi:hypothetical protein
MSDIPVDKNGPVTGSKNPFEVDSNGNVIITKDNAAQIQVHFTVQIYKRLGYLIKMLEEKK